MTNTEFTLLVGAGSLFAGFLGAMTGLGGGVVIVPLLMLVFGVDTSNFMIGVTAAASAGVYRRDSGPRAGRQRNPSLAAAGGSKGPWTPVPGNQDPETAIFCGVETGGFRSGL